MPESPAPLALPAPGADRRDASSAPPAGRGATQRLESLGELSGGMAHDFNNLLMVIMGNAGLLSEALAQDEKLRPLVRGIEDAAQRGADLTRRMLAFARHQHLAPERIDPAGLLAGLQPLLQRTLGDAVQLHIDCAADAGWVSVDVSQLENSLLNLALNARDAMPDGGRFTITLKPLHKEEVLPDGTGILGRDYVAIAVSDTGCGIPPSVRERVFDPFFTTKGKGHGTGLGLSMVFGFIRQSEGHIEVVSEPGTGTTFLLHLPVVSGDTPPAARESRPETAARGGTERVLVVEDDATVRSMIVHLLERAGYRTFETADAAAALATIESGLEIDLMLVDVMLGEGKGGVHLAEVARQAQPALRVLLTSGQADPGAIRACRDGESGFLSKPCPPATLLRMVREVLDA